MISKISKLEKVLSIITLAASITAFGGALLKSRKIFYTGALAQIATGSAFVYLNIRNNRRVRKYAEKYGWDKIIDSIREEQERPRYKNERK